VISNARVTEATAEGFVVTFTATDDLGVTWAPVGAFTVEGWADDAVWQDAAPTGNPDEYSASVRFTDHGGSPGPYQAILWAFDANGNSAYAWAYAPAYEPAAPALGTLQVTGGKVSGVGTGTAGVTLFKGIPYAAPPVGALRWKAPQPVVPWDGVRVCDTFGAICPQPSTSTGGYTEEFYDEGYPEMSEDCLYLNVWTPAEAGAEGLPVMVWFHGGGNAAGWGYEKEFDGEGIASRGVILVTINYRLSVFGFLAHPELSAEAGGHSGNYGLLDQIASLQWVHDNIAAFGGDPGNVTVFGQSAGAFDLSVLACSDMANGLISKAIFQSGGMLSAGAPLADVEQRGAAFAEALGAKSIDELRGMGAAALFQARQDLSLPTQISVDGYVLTDTVTNLLAQGKYMDIPYLIGANEDDLGGHATYAAGITALGDSQIALGRAPIYAYKFIRDLPGGGGAYTTGAFHSAELWYVFETLGRCWRTFEAADYELAGQIADYWTNFAKKGDPNGGGLPAWAPYTAEDKHVQSIGF
jgi:para-nitrobenzyl esterase